LSRFGRNRRGKVVVMKKMSRTKTMSVLIAFLVLLITFTVHGRALAVTEDPVIYLDGFTYNGRALGISMPIIVEPRRLPINTPILIGSFI
jgi:hypothetical protein